MQACCCFATSALFEQHRHECEVRAWLAILMAYPAKVRKAKAAEHWASIERKRGKAAADRLRADVIELWRAGK